MPLALMPSFTASRKPQAEFARYHRTVSAFPPAIREFLAYLRVECGLAANTLLAYERDLRDLIDDLASHGITDPAAVAGADLAGHMRRLRQERNLASNSIIRHLATLRMFFRFLLAEKRIATNPAEVLERPTRWQRLPGCLTPLQMKRLLDTPNPDQGELWLRDRALLELMYAAGLRASEVGTIRVGDVHPILGVVSVTGKGDKQRLVPLGKPALAAVEEYLAHLRPVLAGRGAHDQRLLLSYRGRPLERIAVWQIVRRQATWADLTDVHPHMLRHSFATHLVSGGANLRVVQDLLGHADIRTTQVYTHVDSSRLRDIHRKFHPRG
jgi:integrase/recombinase XerD